MGILDMRVDDFLKEVKKPTANPGGGSVVILIGLMGVNLLRMMDKKDYKDLEDAGSVSRETFNRIEEKLRFLVEEDIRKTKDLIESFKNNTTNEDLFIEAARVQMDFVDTILEAMEESSFILKNGKESTLSDGEIALNIMRDSINSALPTIKINLDNTSYTYDYEGKLGEASRLYEANKKIIEGRLK